MKLTKHILRSTQGAALLTVLIAMMIISIVLLEFQYTSMVERKLAYNELNQLQAYYLAKSGVRVGLLRLSLYGRAKKDPNLKKTTGIDVNPFLEMLWSLPLPAFPPEKDGLKKLLKEDKDAAEKTLAETKVSDGQFSQVITTESAKLNLNFLQFPANSPPDARSLFTPPATSLAQSVAIELTNLIDNFLKESEDPFKEYGNLKPEEVVGDIIDWVNPGTARLMGGGKDSFYEQQNPPYKAKRNRFYTLEELRLVKGMDEHLYNKLKPHVTVYSYDGKVNINNCSTTMLKALYKDFTDDDLKRITEEKNKWGGWTSEKQFVDFITNTLGRSGFKTQFPDDKNYPFTISSQSFLIESLGIMKKSKSRVQKLIRVGVALTVSAKGTSANKNQTDCNADPLSYWNPNTGTCRPKPSTRDACFDEGSSQWDDSRKCCNIRIAGAGVDICYPSGGGSGGATPGAKADPNALKILYWSET
jgi:type II secretory pathway component PulK